MKDCALGIVYNPQKNAVLLIKRKDVPVWVLPGGGIEEGETAENAALREVEEESGYKVSLVKKIAEYTPINRLSRPTYLFECRIEAGEAKTTEESQEVRFYPLNALPKQLFFIHREWIEDALKNSQEVLRKPIYSATYFQVFKHLITHPLIFFRYLFTRICSKE